MTCTTIRSSLAEPFPSPFISCTSAILMPAFLTPLQSDAKTLFTGNSVQVTRNAHLSPSTQPDRHVKSPAQRRHRPPQMLFGLFRRAERYDLNVLSGEHPAIQVEHLRKTYLKRFKGPDKTRQSRTITAVDDLSFTVPRGRILGLLGPNSSGKTTTLRCMATLAEPDSGSIRYYGIDAIKNAHVARQMVGFVAQSAGLDKVLTGREHLDLFAAIAHLDAQTKKRNVDALIDLMQLGDFVDRQSGVYSGGVVRRLDMAIALLHQPAVLILDEPTVGLDIETRMVIWDVLRRWREDGGTIVLTSHYLEEVDVLSDEVGIMEKGVLIAKGTPSELKASLGGDRITVRLEEFTGLHAAETAMNVLRVRGLIEEGIINRLQNNALELVIDASRASVGPDIVQALKDNGFERLFSFSQSKPSLDDVYLAATGKSLVDADSSAKEQRSEKDARKESMA